MTNLVAVLEELKKERAQLDKAITALGSVVSVDFQTPAASNGRVKRKLSLAARKKIAAAQRARWARVRSKKAA
ncbi:MAG: hypothetical protein WBW98_07530 [Candidatus Sulfotelmatobacter sp.]|jgi:hypothetical protein